MSDDSKTASSETIYSADTTSSDKSKPNLMSDRYELAEKIARGGMGEVFRATDKLLNRKVAIKVLQENRGSESSSARRFADEAQIMGQLQHPGIPPIHDLGTLSDGRPFLAMKLIKGETLAELLKQRVNAGSERSRFLAIFEQICQAMAYAHAHDVIHRDLKPSNIMVGPFGEVQVMDWGLAKILGEAKPDYHDPDDTNPATSIHSTRDSDEHFTKAGSILGTPSYMPPEQAIGAVDEVDQQSDVFGLGGILCAILTGEAPFVAEDSESTRKLAARASLEDCYSRLSASSAEPELIKLCKWCLSAEKKNRPDDAESVAKVVANLRSQAEDRARQAELEAVRLEGERQKVELQAKEHRKRRRVQYALTGAIVLVFTLGGIGFALKNLWQQAEDARGKAEAARTAEKEQREKAEQSRDFAEQARSAEKKARQKVEIANAQLAIERKRLAVEKYGRTIEVAHQEWQNNNVVGTRKLLDSTRKDLRGWEWHYLDRLCDCSLLTLKGHKNFVWTAEFSVDGSRVVTASKDKTAKVWDSSSGSEILTLAGHTKSVNFASFSPDGSRIVTASTDKTLKVWDVNTGKELYTLEGHTAPVVTAEFSPDSSCILSASEDRTAKIWDATTGLELLTLKGHRDIVKAAAYSPDGTRIVTAGRDGVAKVWDASIGDELLSFKRHRSMVTSASFSPDGLRIVTTDWLGKARVWDSSTAEELLNFSGNAGNVGTACFSPDGSRIVSISGGAVAGVWDARTADQILTFRGHTHNVSSASFSPDGKMVVTASWDGTAKLWDATKGAEVLTLKGQMGGDKSASSFNSDGTQVVVAGGGALAEVWDATTGNKLLTLKGHTANVTSACFSPDGTRVVTASLDQTARVWDATSGAEILIFEGHQDVVLSARFSPDGSRILTSSRDKAAKVWNSSTGNEIFSLAGHTGWINSACFSPDGSRVVTGGRDGVAKVWDATTGDELLILKGHRSGIRYASFSPDGSRVVTASADTTAKVWDATTGKELITLVGHTDGVNSACFNPDCTRLVTTGDGDRGTAKIWDVSTGAELLTLKGHTFWVWSASFSPDGMRVLTTGWKGKSRIWDSRHFRETRPTILDNLNVAWCRLQIAINRAGLAVTDLRFVLKEVREANLEPVQLRLKFLEKLKDKDKLLETVQAFEQFAEENSVHNYNAACLWSLLSDMEFFDLESREEYAGKAIELLKRVKTGDDSVFSTPAALISQMDRDSDMNPLRNRADYKLFVSSLTQKPVEIAPLPREISR